MTIEQALKKWKTKKRRMGCVSAAAWFCKHVPTFRMEQLHRWTENGEYFHHYVATDGNIRIDLVPHLDRPRED